MPRPELRARLALENQVRLGQSRQRSRVLVTPLEGRMVSVNGLPALDFSSNDYLGLKAHQALLEPLALSNTFGAGASALVSGFAPEHLALEGELAQWLKREAACLFSTGFMANLGVVQTLLKPGELLIQDKRNHASLLDAANYAQLKLRRYRHLDLEGAHARLLEAPHSATLLATDSVFSMDGDQANIPALATLCHTHGAGLLIDEAHALGVFGEEGGGLALDEPHAMVIGTFGKALGSFGAFVAGPRELIQAVLDTSRPYRYTTALPPVLAAVTREAISVVRGGHHLRERLRANIAQFVESARSAGLRMLSSSSPIQPVLIGADAAALLVEARLLERGFFVRAIRPPTVPAGSARLRVSLSAAHSAKQIRDLVAVLSDVC